MNFRFFNPQVLYLIPVLWVAVFFFWKRLRKNSLKQSKVWGEETYLLLTRDLSWAKRKWRWFAFALAGACVLIAIARPQGGQSTQQVQMRGIEIVALVDVSDSMMAEDFKPNRLTQLKLDLSQFIDQQRGSQIGIVAFAGSAVLLSPLTQDPSSLKMYVDSLSPQSVSSQGTEFAAALEEAEEAFNRGGTSSDEKRSVTRVIVIFSDGEDNEPGAEAALEKLVAKGFRIFTVAYGTEKGAPIPVRDLSGVLQGYKKGDDGNPILSTVRGQTLQQMAEKGKGKFFFSIQGGEQMKQLGVVLDQLEKADYEQTAVTSYEEWFQIPLMLGILMLIFERLLNEKRRGPFLWRGRFEVPQ